MNLLFSLYSISSQSGNELEISNFVIDFVKKYCRPITFDIDYAGNIYITKGKAEVYPCVAAHLDEVHDLDMRDSNYQIFEKDGIISARSTADGQPRGLGADDKNGIWVALRLLETEKVLKAVFFVGEEIHCAGSSVADMNFFADCKYIVECDRKGGSDFITVGSGTELCSEDFINFCFPESFGYHPAHGGHTDVVMLKEQGLEIPVCNLSCGYYNPHSYEEYTVISELVKCLEFVRRIVRS